MYYTGEECDGPGGSREGCEVYSDTPACDCYEEDERRLTMDRAGAAELRNTMEVACSRYRGMAWKSVTVIFNDRTPGD